MNYISWFQISNYKIKISNFEFRISNYKTEISNFESRISEVISQISDLKSRISNFGFDILNFVYELFLKFQISDSKLWISNSEFFWNRIFNLSALIVLVDMAQMTLWHTTDPFRCTVPDPDVRFITCNVHYLPLWLLSNFLQKVFSNSKLK